MARSHHTPWAASEARAPKARGLDGVGRRSAFGEVPVSSSAGARARAAVPWVTLLVLSAIALTLLDSFLIGRSTNFFSGRFLMPEPHWTAFHFSAFLLASLAFDA